MARGTVSIGFDRDTGGFHHYRYDPEDPTSIDEGNVYSLFEDHAGVLWAGSMSAGVSRYDHEVDRFVRFEPDFAPGGGGGIFRCSGVP